MYGLNSALAEEEKKPHFLIIFFNMLKVYFEAHKKSNFLSGFQL